MSAAQHRASRAFTDNVLFYWTYGMDSEEIAEVLSCSEALVYNVLSQLPKPVSDISTGAAI